MSHMRELMHSIGESFPRVSGDEPGHGRGLPLLSKFSPREWG